MIKTDAASLAYHEPSIETILVLTSLLLLSNVVNYALNRLLYCGLIGQILIGVAFGTPGGRWLDENTEAVIVQLGYLGLILLVYEGGLFTSFKSLKANLLLSIFVALTGICIPIALSFTLTGTANATPLQSFAAGAALCSTSLGTTFTILGTTGLLKTRLGVVLTSAAMLDDVLGLVMVQVISNLGGSGSDFSATTIVRPIFVSLGFALAGPLICWLVLLPVTHWLNGVREDNHSGLVNRIFVRHEIALVFHTALLIAMVTGASYAGTSNLFAAYLAGAVSSWWDAELPHVSHETDQTPDSINVPALRPLNSASTIYETLYAQANDRVLKPFFFASIGFSIPITRMFHSSTVWRGIIYSILMTMGKLTCGIWLIRLALDLNQHTILHRVRKLARIHVPHLWGQKTAKSALLRVQREEVELRSQPRAESSSTNQAKEDTSNKNRTTPEPSSPALPGTTAQISSTHTTTPEKPVSLYPAAILGLAMVARGEIGFLISSLAESNGIFNDNGNDQIFLIVTWAIVLCTILGPIGVGLLVRRVRRLEKEKGEGGGDRDVLGAWGVE